MEQTIEQFLQRLTTFYKADHIAPGLQLAYLADQEKWYVAVHQFPSNLASRRVVAKATEATLKDALLQCWTVWDSLITQLQLDRAGVN